MWLSVFLWEQTGSNLEMTDGFRRVKIAALLRSINWSRLITVLHF